MNKFKVGIITITILLVVLVYFMFTKEEVWYSKIYYLEEENIYINILHSNKVDHANVYFNTNSDFSDLENTDCLKISKRLATIIILDRQQRENVKIIENGSVLDIKGINLKFSEGYESRDSTYFQYVNNEAFPSVVREPYDLLSIGEGLRRILLKKSNTSRFEDISPLENGHSLR